MPGVAFGADPAVADGDGAAQGAADGRVVGDHDHGGAQVLVGRLDQVDDGRGGCLVELAGGLVGEQQPRPVGQGDRDGEALLLAAGQPPGGAAGDPGQADRFQQVAGPAAFDGPPAGGWAAGRTGRCRWRSRWAAGCVRGFAARRRFRAAASRRLICG